ncbi:hypothetical protein DEO72_LG7g1969 [Vigna unguiculata]|uniref:Uncharacterized protein n=1 Tax=Vigna unguiculata TaxID=3917 RepID=A0A4D6MKI8_VIGUN|nr:hypothetical protein DEO72_LG7g1969 [Vigna unguiculata]
MGTRKEERKANRKRIWLKGKDSYCMVMTISGAIPTMGNNMDKPKPKPKPCYEKGVFGLVQCSLHKALILPPRQSESGTWKEKGK